MELCDISLLLKGSDSATSPGSEAGVIRISGGSGNGVCNGDGGAVGLTAEAGERAERQHVFVLYDGYNARQGVAGLSIHA